ncbi:MAG: hypothetical protein ABSG77_14640 [Candidatus Acidiferrum sp.]|jgi:hypothetical protein
MNKHPYLRAYLAGIAVPTVFLLVIMTSYTIIRYVWDVPIPIERVIVFPMAAVPNAWGLWNVLYRAFFAGRRVSLGVFGGALPLLLAPGGYVVARLLGFTVPHVVFVLAPFALPVGLIIYYLAWKYFVGFLNAELGIA